jgi:hypothetical protein
MSLPGVIGNCAKLELASAALELEGLETEYG